MTQSSPYAGNRWTLLLGLNSPGFYEVKQTVQTQLLNTPKQLNQQQQEQPMDIFDLDRCLVEDYQRFARSFTTIRARDILAAARDEGAVGLGQEDFGVKVRQKLGFVAANRNRRKEWMADPEAIGVRQLDAERAIGQVLGHRVWVDQRRGWRFTNPNLEELGLVRAIYPGLDEFVADEEQFRNTPSVLQRAAPSVRKEAFRCLFDHLRRGLATTADSLQQATTEQIASASQQHLREPWSVSQREDLRRAAALLLRTVQAGVRDDVLIVKAGASSNLARQLRNASIWGQRLTVQDYRAILEAMLPLLDEKRLEMVARNRSIKAKDGELLAKLLTAFVRKADEGTIGKLIVEAIILLSAKSQSDGGKVLRTAAQAYGVDTDAVAHEVKQQFTAKEKARKATKPERKPAAKAKRAA